MSNTIRRARRRPRVTSYNWRTFKWLLLRVAVERMLALDGTSYRWGSRFHQWLARTPTSNALNFGVRFYLDNPERRIRP